MWTAEHHHDLFVINQDVNQTLVTKVGASELLRGIKSYKLFSQYQNESVQIHSYDLSNIFIDELITNCIAKGSKRKIQEY